MTTSLVEISRNLPATMNTSDLADTIGKSVRTALRRSEDAQYAYNAAKREREAYFADMSVEANRREAQRLDDAVKTALAKRDEAFDNIDKYIEDQKAMFASKGLNPNFAYRQAIVPTGELTKSGQQVFRIIPRGDGNTLEPVDDDDDTRPSVQASRSYSDRIGISNEGRRGRYNDAAILIEQSAASVDPEEVTEWSRACL